MDISFGMLHHSMVMGRKNKRGLIRLVNLFHQVDYFQTGG
jgi:hypothetical protein